MDRETSQSFCWLCELDKKSLFRGLILLILLLPFLLAQFIQSKMILSLLLPISVFILLFTTLVDESRNLANWTMVVINNKKIGPLGFIMLLIGNLIQLISIIVQIKWVFVSVSCKLGSGLSVVFLLFFKPIKKNKIRGSLSLVSRLRRDKMWLSISFEEAVKKIISFMQTSIDGFVASLSRLLSGRHTVVLFISAYQGSSGTAKWIRNYSCSENDAFIKYPQL